LQHPKAISERLKIISAVSKRVEASSTMDTEDGRSARTLLIEQTEDTVNGRRFEAVTRTSVVGIQNSDVSEIAKNQAKRKKNMNSLLNATAFPLFMAILVTVIKDGESFTFYTTLMPLTFVGLALQIVLAIAIVAKNGLSYHPEETDPTKMRKRLHRSTFDMWLQILTTVSLAINLAVHAFFTARVLKSDPNL
jgi:hypothetical protein